MGDDTKGESEDPPKEGKASKKSPRGPSIGVSINQGSQNSQIKTQLYTP